MECGAKKRNGQPCKAPSMKNGRCRIHGGKSLAGTASPRFKTGAYSKYLPARLKGKYEEFLADPDLFTLNNETALIKSRLSELTNALTGAEEIDLEKWAEIAALTESHRRLSATERRHLIDSQRVINIQSVVLLLSAVLATVTKHVTDRATLNSINTELSAYLALTDTLSSGSDLSDAQLERLAGGASIVDVIIQP